MNMLLQQFKAVKSRLHVAQLEVAVLDEQIRNCTSEKGRLRLMDKKLAVMDRAEKLGEIYDNLLAKLDVEPPQVVEVNE